LGGTTAGFAGDLGGAGGAVFPAGGGGGVFPAGGGGGVFPAGGAGGALPAGGAGGALPAGGAGGALPAGGGGVFPAGGGGVLPAAGGALAVPGVPAAGLAGDLASLAGVLAALGSTLAAAAGSAAGGAIVAFTFLGLPKSSSVVSGRISVTIPAAMVLPPSLSAKREPFPMVMGKLSLALMVKLSPGLAILVPSGRQISAAVSAVLK
jgi:hypothetical protein